MCIILFGKKNSFVKHPEILKEAFKFAGNGAGLMYFNSGVLNNNALMTTRALMTADALCSAISELRDIEDRDMAVHFRSGQHQDSARTQPITITSGREAFMFHGQLEGMQDKTKRSWTNLNNLMIQLSGITPELRALVLKNLRGSSVYATQGKLQMFGKFVEMPKSDRILCSNERFIDTKIAPAKWFEIRDKTTKQLKRLATFQVDSIREGINRAYDLYPAAEQANILVNYMFDAPEYSNIRLANAATPSEPARTGLAMRT